MKDNNFENLLNKNPLCWLLEGFHITTAGHLMKLRICFHLMVIQKYLISHIAMRFLSEPHIITLQLAKTHHCLALHMRRLVFRNEIICKVSIWGGIKAGIQMWHCHVALVIFLKLFLLWYEPFQYILFQNALPSYWRVVRVEALEILCYSQNLLALQ